jgi:hypothetical protein
METHVQRNKILTVGGSYVLSADSNVISADRYSQKKKIRPVQIATTAR